MWVNSIEVDFDKLLVYKGKVVTAVTGLSVETTQQFTQMFPGQDNSHMFLFELQFKHLVVP